METVPIAKPYRLWYTWCEGRAGRAMMVAAARCSNLAAASPSCSPPERRRSKTQKSARRVETRIEAKRQMIQLLDELDWHVP